MLLPGANDQPAGRECRAICEVGTQPTTPGQVTLGAQQAGRRRLHLPDVKTRWRVVVNDVHYILQYEGPSLKLVRCGTPGSGEMCPIEVTEVRKVEGRQSRLHGAGLPFEPQR